MRFFSVVLTDFGLSIADKRGPVIWFVVSYKPIAILKHIILIV